MPPPVSPYYENSDVSAINSVESQLFDIDNFVDSACIFCGDFNARTGDLDDFVIIDN